VSAHARAAAVQPVAGAATLYAEDLHVGSVMELGTHRLSEDEIMAFASEWDPQLMHVDRAAARSGPFGGIIASGVHTIAVFHRLQVAGLLARAAVIAGRGMRDMRLPAPIRAGDVVTGRVEIIEHRLRPHRHDALVVVRGTLVNQDGELVYEMVGDVLIACRPPIDGTPTTRGS
jgi:acyl dehydratase